MSSWSQLFTINIYQYHANDNFLFVVKCLPPSACAPIVTTSCDQSIWIFLFATSLIYRLVTQYRLQWDGNISASGNLIKALKLRACWLETVLNEAPCNSLTKHCHKLQRSSLSLHVPLCFIFTCLSGATDRRIASVYACVRCVCVCTSVCIHVEARVQPWVSFLRHHSPFLLYKVWHGPGT